MQTREIKILPISAKGTDNQIPFMPIILGNTKTNITIKKSVLKNEINAEIFPFDKAVNIPDAKIFIPCGLNEIPNKRSPTFVSSNASLPASKYIPTKKLALITVTI